MSFAYPSIDDSSSPPSKRKRDRTIYDTDNDKEPDRKMKHTEEPATPEVLETAGNQSERLASWAFSVKVKRSSNNSTSSGIFGDDEGTDNEGPLFHQSRLSGVSTYTIESEKLTSQDYPTNNTAMLACTRCKRLKVKCEFKSETRPCKRCLNGGHDCAILGKCHNAKRKRQHRSAPAKLGSYPVVNPTPFLGYMPVPEDSPFIYLPSPYTFSPSPFTSSLYFPHSDAKVNKAQDGLSGARDSLAKWGGYFGSLPGLGNSIANDNDNYHRINAGKLANEVGDADVKIAASFDEEIPKEKLASSIGSNFSNKKKDSCAATGMLVTLPNESVLFNCVANNEDFFGSTPTPDDTELATQVFKFLRSQEPWKLLSKLNLTPSWVSGIMQIVQKELDRSARNVKHGEYGRKCMRLLRKMAQNYGALPPSFLLADLAPAGNRAVCGGGFSDIWKGKLGDQDVCIKVLRVFTTVKMREELVKQFCHEAIIWGQLKHPNILPFLGVSFDLFDPSFCLVSPWMENGNVLQFLERKSTYDRMTVIREVAEGLKYLHAFNPPVVHGDIRGANILVTSDLRFCLADFGLAAVVESQIFTTTSADDIKGTTRWMAPEVLLPPTNDKSTIGNTTPFRDIYAFACTVLELCTGRVPFYEDRLDITVAHKVLGGQRPQRPSPDIWFPDELWDLVQTCWVEDPARRPTAAEVVELLGQADKSLSEH